MYCTNQLFNLPLPLADRLLAQKIYGFPTNFGGEMNDAKVSSFVGIWVCVCAFIPDGH